MFINFAALIAALGPGAAAVIANRARTPANYLFNTFLPERARYGYSIQSGNVTIRATMAGLVGMDSPYPPGGAITSTSLSERTAKIANEIPINEQTMRTLQEMLLHLQVSNAPTNDVVLTQLLNFVAKVIVQPHLDTAEWMRGRALTTGRLQWTMNGIILDVDYGMPSANLLTARAGNDAYGGSTSKFHTDWKAARRILKRVRAVIAHPTTIDEIRFNTVNQLVTIREDENGVTLRRTNSDGSFTSDALDVMTFIPYDLEAEVIDPAAPGGTKTIPFMEVGKVIFVAPNTVSGFAVNVDEGSTEDPNRSNELGYTHIAPTVEGGGVPGRWADLFTPQHEPYKVIGRGASNLLPVLEAADKVVVATTAIA